MGDPMRQVLLSENQRRLSRGPLFDGSWSSGTAKAITTHRLHSHTAMRIISPRFPVLNGWIFLGNKILNTAEGTSMQKTLNNFGE